MAPAKAGVAMFDVMIGMHAAISILGVLCERGMYGRGRGQQLEANLLSSALFGLVNQTGGYASAGNVPTRLGGDHPSGYPYGPFATADRG